MIEIEIASLEDFAAVLARVPVPFKNIVPRELDLLLRQAIEQAQKDHARDPNLKGDGVNAVGMWRLEREIPPLGEAECLKRTVVTVEDDLRVSLKHQSESPSYRANVHCLPEAIQHQHMLIEV